MDWNDKSVPAATRLCFCSQGNTTMSEVVILMFRMNHTVFRHGKITSNVELVIGDIISGRCLFEQYPAVHKHSDTIDLHIGA